ncbi:leucyl-tRNA synthetase [Zopfia rhizophila CBS 207.26]|uniref:leucine--tRNA ligase n=1 Tax=Zopfia rhizophila CBS 207.26 TaxID=1314779 RepID=A0A6A6DWJ9_9PEZI|nr:leucyl-tRNA synthetase [Zopfia rhizophila CBS 207.26]
MFPYPSGTLHLGHLRVYTISDVLARFKQMQGYDVIHPIGWDAFGLPAENAAIERGIHPRAWTLSNITGMKKQMMAMGGRWDWDREILTCEPEFYKHTQRIFLMLYKRGLAYQAESLVNYDPVDKTVLANEQVDSDGCSWRSGAKVERKMLKQWFLKIKEFQKPLFEDLDILAKNGKWPERVLAMQKNWLGRSEGVKLQFEVQSKTGLMHPGLVEVFTTRADTLFGVQYIALSLNHPIAQMAAEKDRSLRAFLGRAQGLPPDSKEGYLLPNLSVRDPLARIMDGRTEPIPIYVAPYVLDDYGSGAVMGVPGHDSRDHAFWRANADNAPIKQVITLERGVPEPLVSGSENDKPMLTKGFVSNNIKNFSGLSSDEAVNEIVKLLREAGVSIEKTENWRLRDWLVSRQRYWGTPIPIIHCRSCGSVPVPEKDLPVELPRISNKKFAQLKGGNPLSEASEWKKTTCPQCGSDAERETDTMDTFMDSSWYFFRFLDPKNQMDLVNPSAANAGMPVDVYVGGVEHAILHLLYARFISKFLATTSAWPSGGGPENRGEPFKRLITQGMVHGKTYSDPETGRFLRPEEVDLRNPASPLIKTNGRTANISFEKMSKSKHNGVDPGATITQYGADVTRAHMLFQAPVSDVLEWDATKLTGVQRWLSRVIRLSKGFFIPKNIPEDFIPPYDLDIQLPDLLSQLVARKLMTPAKQPHPNKPWPSEEAAMIGAMKESEMLLWTKTQETIASVTKSYSETYSLNTIVSDLMTLTNLIWDTPHASRLTCYLQYQATAHLLRMLAPIAPAVAEEGWELLHEKVGTVIESDSAHPLRLKGGPSIFAHGFPTADMSILPALKQTLMCVVQIDGKKKFQVEIRKPAADVKPSDLEGHIFSKLLETEKGKEWLEKGTGKLWKNSGTNVPHEECPWIPKGHRSIVVKDGKLVNIVCPERGQRTMGGMEANAKAWDEQKASAAVDFNPAQASIPRTNTSKASPSKVSPPKASPQKVSPPKVSPPTASPLKEKDPDLVEVQHPVTKEIIPTVNSYGQLQMGPRILSQTELDIVGENPAKKRER